MEIKKASLSDFDLVFSEIEKNFILDERREREDALRLFTEKKYDIILFIKNEVNVGFITAWTFSDFTFLEHFVIYENFRNKGYGAEALSALKEEYPILILEAEPPQTDIASRRLGFYKRCGFQMNDQIYYQPSYRKGGNEVRLVIMSYPDPIIDYENIISAIQREIYLKQ